MLLYGNTDGEINGTTTLNTCDLSGLNIRSLRGGVRLIIDFLTVSY